MDRCSPSLHEFENKAKNANVVPIYQEIVCDQLTPVLAAKILGGSSVSYLLESIQGSENWSRYSFVGVDPDIVVQGKENLFQRITSQGISNQTNVDPWNELTKLMKGFHAAEMPELPRFWGGAVGYISYDTVRRFEPTVGQASGTNDRWDFSLAIGGTLLVFDNLKQTLKVIAPILLDHFSSPEQAYEDGKSRIERCIEKIQQPISPHFLSSPYLTENAELPPSNFKKEDFFSAVETAKKHIQAGDIFQVVLSQRFRIPAEGIHPFDVYRMMRVINPSPYMYYLNFPNVSISGASPETLVRCIDGRAEVRPIAGTRPRGKTQEQDDAHAQDLLADPKEKAEHVMLVDLGRNDLGRVCKPGTVQITENMIIERYSHVMHIVSNVVGELKSDLHALDLLPACFPAGTLSGAPKVRAMQIIDELEPEPRGIYGGAVGYIGFDGNLDVAIAIRTLVQRDKEIWIQAGAGIVEASDPEYEYQETLNKAKAALLAVASAKTLTQDS